VLPNFILVATRSNYPVDPANPVLLNCLNGGHDAALIGEHATTGPPACPEFFVTASVSPKWSIIRSLHHNDAGHSTGDQIMFTGYPSPPDLPAEGPGNQFPSCGAVVAKQLQQKNPRLPAYVMIPKMVPGTGGAYLGTPCEPFETIADPAREGPFRIPLFQMPNGVTLQRLGERRAMLENFDQLRRDVDKSGLMEEPTCLFVFRLA